MKSQDIRATFLNFFKEKSHLIVPSAPMVTRDDPTLMFVNSGMAPFKEYFLGNGKPKNDRISDSQKCLRVSGKHNDLEEVGYDTYHHTLFEMLGNWSFGDYFKKEAISWAWELLTEVYKIDKDILYVTVFEGSDDADNLKMDTEAYDLWKQFIAEDRILKGNKKDNFWEKEFDIIKPKKNAKGNRLFTADDIATSFFASTAISNQSHPITTILMYSINKLASAK